MNNNSEREFWVRAVNEVLSTTDLTVIAFAERMGVSVRQVYNWRDGVRPSGLAAIRFYFYRKELLEPELFRIHKDTLSK